MTNGRIKKGKGKTCSTSSQGSRPNAEEETQTPDKDKNKKTKISKYQKLKTKKKKKNLTERKALVTQRLSDLCEISPVLHPASSRNILHFNQDFFLFPFSSSFRSSIFLSFSIHRISCQSVAGYPTCRISTYLFASSQQMAFVLSCPEWQAGGVGATKRRDLCGSRSPPGATRETATPFRDTKLQNVPFKSGQPLCCNFQMGKKKQKIRSHRLVFSGFFFFLVCFVALLDDALKRIHTTPTATPHPHQLLRQLGLPLFLFALISHAATMSSFQSAHRTTTLSLLLDTKASVASPDFAPGEKCPDKALSNVK